MRCTVSSALSGLSDGSAHTVVATDGNRRNATAGVAICAQTTLCRFICGPAQHLQKHPALRDRRPALHEPAQQPAFGVAGGRRARTSVLAAFSWSWPGDCAGCSEFHFNSATPTTLNGTRRFHLLNLINLNGYAATTAVEHRSTATARFGSLSSSHAAVTDTVTMAQGGVATLQFRLQLDGGLSGSTPTYRTSFLPFTAGQLDQRDSGRRSNFYSANLSSAFDPLRNTFSMGIGAVNTAACGIGFPQGFERVFIKECAGQVASGSRSMATTRWPTVEPVHAHWCVGSLGLEHVHHRVGKGRALHTQELDASTSNPVSR